MANKTNCKNNMCEVLMFSVLEEIINLESFLDKEYEENDARTVSYFNPDVFCELEELYSILP